MKRKKINSKKEKMNSENNGKLKQSKNFGKRKKRKNTFLSLY